MLVTEENFMPSFLCNVFSSFEITFFSERDLCKINEVFVAKVDFPRSIIAAQRIRMHYSTQRRAALALLAKHRQ